MKFKPSFPLYLGAGVLFFFFWILIVFPYEALQSRVITEIENRTGGRYKIDMTDMNISLFGSVSFKNFKVSEWNGTKDETLLKAPKLKIGFSPFGFLGKKIDFDFYLKGEKKGDIEGDFKQSPEEMELNADLDQFSLTEMEFLALKTHANINGDLTGQVQLKINSVDPSQNKGKVDLNLENLSVAATKISLDPSDPNSSYAIPKIKISGSKGSHIRGEVAQDRFNLQSMILTGGDLDLNLKGKIILRGRTPADYRLALEGSFKVSDPLSKAIPIFFILEKEKTPDGRYPISLSGRLGRPNLRIGKFQVPI